MESLIEFTDAVITTAEEEALYFPDIELRHLAGKHNQKTHGHGGGTAVAERPRRRPKATAANKPKAAKSFVVDGKEHAIVDAKQADLPAFTKLHQPTYTPEEAEVVKRYTSEDHSHINSVLRYDEWSKFKSRRQFEEEDVANLRSAIDKNTIQQDVIVRRRANFESLGLDPLDPDGDPRSVVGSVVQDRGFMSTTLGKFDLAEGFHYVDEPVELNIRVPKGTKGLHLSNKDLTKFPDEHEVLLGDGTKLAILGATQKGGTWLIDAQVL